MRRPKGISFERQREYKPRVGAKPSRRRPEVTELLVQGLSNRQIAERLGIARGTVEWFAGQIYRRHGVHGRAELRRALGGKAFLVAAPRAG